MIFEVPYRRINDFLARRGQLGVLRYSQKGLLGRGSADVEISHDVFRNIQRGEYKPAGYKPVQGG